jgi:predicted amidohydrolase
MDITLLQTDIVWENKEANLNKLEKQLKQLSGKTQLAVLPEMFSTGFSMNSHKLAESNQGTTISTLCKWSKLYNIALTGSFIAKENDQFYNRGFFLTPQGGTFFYDKHHLFSVGDESLYFSAGNKQLLINYEGFNILLLICYDLRFPIWSRNTENRYDLLIYVANWPASRRQVWDVLLKARALENMSYVCGVNRVGTDGNGLNYNGGSVLISPKGTILVTNPDDTESLVSAKIEKESMNRFREKFPVWKDADKFTL